MYDKKAHYDPEIVRPWVRGYVAGYAAKEAEEETTSYLRGFAQGGEDRLEDEEAIASGTFDLLTEAERLLIYGPEERVSEYRES